MGLPYILGKHRATGLMRWVTEHRYGGPTHTVASTPVITTTPAAVAFVKPDRVSFYAWNLGTVTVFLHIAASVNSLSGIPLLPNAGIAVLQEQDDTLVTEAWFAVVSSGTSQLLTYETISDTILDPEEK